MNKVDKVLKSIISLAQEWMGDKGSALTPRVHCRGKGVPDGKYFINITKINAVNLLVQEFVLSPQGDNILFRIWTLKKEGRWDVVSLEKNKKHVYLRDYAMELEDLFRRMTLLQRVMTSPGFYYNNEVANLDQELFLPPIPEKPFGFRAFRKWAGDLSLKPVVFVPILSGVLLVLTIVVASYAINMNKIKGEIDGSIDQYVARLEGELETLDTFREEAESDLLVLKGNLAREQADFDFNRQNAYVNVLRLSEELTKYLPARKEAYHLIADNIHDSISYGEIIYEMSRLPTAEYQARIFLATDRQKVVPLGRFEPVVPGISYPVQVASEDNNGLGFRITDGFMESRDDPLGAGGQAPHYAVDIINVANISLINYAGQIVRDGNASGNVVAVSDGMVKSAAFNDRYGWNTEIEHPLSRELKKIYPSATGWSSYYAHMEALTPQAEGDWVAQGEKIGDIGNTGASTGPHLHFEVRIYHAKGYYRSVNGDRFDKVNPYPN